VQTDGPSPVDYSQTVRHFFFNKFSEPEWKSPVFFFLILMFWTCFCAFYGHWSFENEKTPSIVPSNKPYHHPFPPKKLTHSQRKKHTKSTKQRFCCQQKIQTSQGPMAGWVGFLMLPRPCLPALWPLRSASRMWNHWAARRCRFGGVGWGCVWGEAFLFGFCGGFEAFLCLVYCIIIIYVKIYIYIYVHIQNQIEAR